MASRLYPHRLTLASAAQGGAWEFSMQARAAAYRKGNYTEAENQLSAAFEKTEAFGPWDPRLA